MNTVLPSPYRCRETGFTLIETMMALAIFAIGSLGILAILMSGFGIAAQGNNTTGGFEVAQAAIGLIRANGSNALEFDGASVDQGGSVSSSGNGANTVVANAVSTWANLLKGLPQGSGQITVSTLSGASLCPCSATVSVAWRQNGILEHYSVQSIVGY